MANRKKWLIGYVVICMLYFALSVAKPHELLVSHGLEGIGKPSLKIQTEEIQNDTEINFAYEVGEEPLSELTFYFTANEDVFTQGELTFEAYNQETGELLVKNTEELKDLKVEGFLGVSFKEIGAISNCTVEVQITGLGIKEGPGIWLNTETQTEGSTYVENTQVEQNLIYNAVGVTTTHYVKKPLLMLAMLLILGVMAFSGSCLSTKKSGKVDKKSRINVEMWKKQFKKYRHILGIGFLVALVGMIFYYTYDVQIRKAMNTTHQEVVMKDNYNMLPITEENSSFVQTYITEEEELVGLGVRMDIGEDATLEGSIEASVTDTTTGELLCDTSVDATSLLDGQYVGLIFHNSQSDIKGHAYEIKLDFSEELFDSGLSVFVTPEGFYEENTLLINGEESNLRLSMNAHTYFNLFLKKYFFAMCAFTMLFAMGFYYLTFIRKCKVEKIFLFTILCLGVIYNFIITPYMTPDESYHIDMTYRHSNTLLGIESAGEKKCFKREGDTLIDFTSEPSLTNYKNIYDGLFQAIEKGELIEAEATADTKASAIVYLPAVLGMSLARVLQLGTIPMLLLARWCSLLAYAGFVYFGMKKLPFGKISLFLISIFPMTLQQCTSFSYDAVITGTIVLFSCYCISLAYGKEQVKVRDIITMGILSILFVYGKSGVYLPICLLAFLIPTEKFANVKARWICQIGLILLPIISFLNMNTATVSYVATTTAATSTVGSSTTQGYTLSYFLSQPMELVTMIANTVADKTAFYVQSLVGQKMGWVEIEISELVPMFFLLLLILSVMKGKEEPVFVKTWQKWWVVLTCGACFGIILLGMLLTWTPNGNVSIEGVQGRYLLPILPVFLLVGRNNCLTYERNIEKGLLYAGFLGQLFTIMYLIKAVLLV